MRSIFIVCIGAIALGGCATVTRGTTNQMQIVSEPTGVTARTSLGHQCSTPCTLQVNRKDEFSVVFTHPGYEEQTVRVITQLAGAGAAGFAGNVILGGVVGMGVDAATGSTLEHVPNPVSVVMKPLARPAPAPRTRTPAQRSAPKPASSSAPTPAAPGA